MERRDIILDQIKQAGKVLGIILSKALDLDTSATLLDIQEVSQQLKSQLDLRIDKLIDLDEDAFRKEILSTSFGVEQLEKLSSFLKLAGTKKKEKAYFEKALILLEMCDDLSETLSFERLRWKDEIRELI